MPSIESERIARIEKVVLQFERPRSIGRNAMGGEQRTTLFDPVVRIHTDSGAVGVGWSSLEREDAEGLVGKSLGELFRLPDGCLPPGLKVDLPLWDLAAKLSDQPLYRLLGARGSREVGVYDGSIYMNDLGATDDQAAEIIRDSVRSGQARGYGHFKIKIGRGARWMPIMEGLERDILVIHAVRVAAGPDAKIMIDTNSGGTLNTTKETLRQCADVGIYWFEEPFHEQRSLVQDLHEFIEENGYGTFIADGESSPPKNFFDMVEAGWIDVVQQDFRLEGLTWWKATADRIEPWGALCGPHCWHSVIERYAHAHFAASVPHYTMLEAAPAETPGIVLDGWGMRDSKLIVPDTPGTGFDIDPDVLERSVKAEDGFRIPA